MEKTYDYRMYGKTESGKEVIIFDDKYNLQEYKAKVVDYLIDIFMIQDINSIENEEYDPRQPILEGRFIGKYELPKKWDACKKDNESLYDICRKAVEIKDGIMVIDSSELKETINKGDDITFKVGRLDLMAWLPIEEQLTYYQTLSSIRFN